MKLAEAIQIGREHHCMTIGDVDELMERLFNKYNVITEQEYEEYLTDSDKWCDHYENFFQNLYFVDCKI